VKAGLLDKMPQVNNAIIPEGPAASGQTNAHKEDTPYERNEDTFSR
jgi:hypothetical protein